MSYSRTLLVPFIFYTAIPKWSCFSLAKILLFILKTEARNMKTGNKEEEEEIYSKTRLDSEWT